MNEEEKFITEPTEEEIVTESMEDYAAELEASFRSVNEGEILTGTIIDVKETGVIVDLGYYAQGVISAADLSADPKFSIMADVQPGDVVQASVIARDDGMGNIRLSCKEAAQTLGWERLKELCEQKTAVSVKISEAVNQGVVAYVEGIRGFIPASQLDLDYVEDTAPYVNRKMMVRVTSVDKSKERVILSAKVLLREQQEEELRHKIAMIIPGTVMEGRVESLMPYGAFVDLGGGLNGLVHISQISQRRIIKPSEVLKVGDAVKVKVLNTNDHKISLSIKAVEEDARAEEAEEGSSAAQEFSDNEAVGTSLAALLKGFKF